MSVPLHELGAYLARVKLPVKLIRYCLHEREISRQRLLDDDFALLAFPFPKIEDGEKTARVGLSEFSHAFDGLAFIRGGCSPSVIKTCRNQRGERGKGKRS